MHKVYRIIRRKRNLRRLAVLWVFLLVIELFCPVLGDEQAFAAEIPTPKTRITTAVDKSDESSQTSLDVCREQDRHHEQTSCNDECLCHATAIPSINIISFNETVSRNESIPFRYGNPVFNSLPPPFQPPKNS
jgi:hypothetical protein